LCYCCCCYKFLLLLLCCYCSLEYNFSLENEYQHLKTLCISAVALRRSWVKDAEWEYHVRSCTLAREGHDGACVKLW
jgi:hypothetical protein